MKTQCNHQFVQHFVYYSLAFLDALPHLCLHVDLVNGDNDFLSVLIGLMEDSDPVVRRCFSQSVRCLLMETERSPLSEVSQHVLNKKIKKTLTVLKAVFLSHHPTYVPDSNVSDNS